MPKVEAKSITLKSIEDPELRVLMQEYVSAIERFKDSQHNIYEEWVSAKANKVVKEKALVCYINRLCVPVMG